MGKGSAIPIDPQHTPTILQPSYSQPQKTQKPRKPNSKNTQVPQPGGSTEHLADEVVYKEFDDRLVRAATTASSLEAEQDSGNIDKTQSKATHNEASSPGTTSGGGPKWQEAIGDTIAQTRFENVAKLTARKSEEVFVEKEVANKEVSAAGEVNAASIATTICAASTITTKEITLAQALMEMKTSKPKAKRIVLQEPNELDEEAALKLYAKLQAEFDEEQRLARERESLKKEANIALIET
nr:hypothetical protein [Tanacetum cinerariifolium]